MLADDSEASADSEAWDRLGEFVERDPYTPGAFRFRHALFRDAAYEGLSYKRRGELHTKVGEAYERLEGEGRGEFAELLSLHFFHAGDAEKSYRYSLVAGERAQAKFANVEAAVFYRRALDLAPQLELDPAELARVWEAVGDVSELAGLYADAEEAYEQARDARRAPSPAVEGRCDPRALRALPRGAALVQPRPALARRPRAGRAGAHALRARPRLRRASASARASSSTVPAGASASPRRPARSTTCRRWRTPST